MNLVSYTLVNNINKEVVYLIYYFFIFLRCLMNSSERRELRYRRRCEKRNKKIDRRCELYSDIN